MTYETQTARVLSLLQSKDVVTLPELLDLRIASLTRRVSDLRAQGWLIECSETRVGKQRRTSYRLVGNVKSCDPPIPS